MMKDFARYIFLQWFRRKYNDTKVIASYFVDPITGFYSQAGQDAFIYSEFFSLLESEQLPKLFVDIGCNHPIKYSNSYFFEAKLGFKVIAVDPLPTYISEWASTRPNSTLHTVALGSNKGTLTLSVPAENSNMRNISHSSDMFATLNLNNPRLATGEWKAIDVPVITAQDLFDANGIFEVGIVSIDVEGYEMEVLKGINFKKTKIFIAIIENNTHSRFGDDDIRLFMNENGFDFYARIWGLDDVFVRKDLNIGSFVFKV